MPSIKHFKTSSTCKSTSHLNELSVARLVRSFTVEYIYLGLSPFIFVNLFYNLRTLSFGDSYRGRVYARASIEISVRVRENARWYCFSKISQHIHSKVKNYHIN